MRLQIETDSAAWADLARKRLEVWMNSPEIWAREVLGVELTEPQNRFAQLVVSNKRTAVRSANGMGKTHGAAVLLLWFCSTRKGIVLSTAPTWSHVKHRLWGEVAKLYRSSQLPLGGDFLPDGCRWRLGDYWEAFGLSTNDESNFQGGHAENLLILFDEAQGVDAKIWGAAESMMVGQKARWLVIGNPLEPKGDFHKAFSKPAEWATATLSALEHPNYIAGEERIPGAVTREWVNERREAWGENDPRYQARILGEFPEQGDDRVVPNAYLEKAVKALAQDSDEGIHIGVDVARFGTDETVLLVMRDGVVEQEKRYAGLDGLQVAGAVQVLAKEVGVTSKDALRRIHIDPIGVGASVMDSLKAVGWKCDAVNFAEKPRGTYRDECGDMAFANQRAELWWACRELLRLNRLCIPSRFGHTWEELSEPGYHYDSKGRLVVEAKDKVKARLGRSPDGADAVCLALARRGPGEQIYL